MRTRALLLLPLLLLLVLVMPGTAHAEGATTLPQAEWEAQLNAAIDGSAIFLPGVTLTVTTGPIADPPTVEMTVHPDGSMDGRRPSGSGTERIRCVRVDRCWAQSAAIFKDMRWHRAPAGSVMYVGARSYWWSTVMGMPRSADSDYSTVTGQDGTIVYAVGLGSPLAYTVVGTTVNGGAITTITLLMLNNDVAEMRGATAVMAPAAPTILAPRRTQMGAPAMSVDPWLVPINPPASAAAPASS